MTTYGSTIARGRRVVDGDVAKGMKPWEAKRALEAAKKAGRPSQRLKFDKPVSHVSIEPSADARRKGAKVVRKAFGGPARRAASYAEWSHLAGPANSHASGLGPGQKTLTRAIGLSESAKNPDARRRASSLWQRDNNRRGSWRGLHAADGGKHVNLDDTRWESGVYGLNTKQQRKMATADRLRREGKQVSPVKARRGVANDLQMYEHPDDFTARVRRGQFKKGVGVAPVLARRAPAAGRGGRRILTGDQVNVRRVIGKNDEVAKAGLEGVGAIGNTLRAIRQPKALLGGLKTGFAAGRAGEAATSLRGPLTAGGTGHAIGGAIGRNPMKSGLAAGAAGGAGLMGLRGRRQAGFMPSYAASSPFGKRSYDPEGERRWRQGAAAAGTGIGGAALTVHGAQGIRNDTRELRKIPQMQKRPVPASLSMVYTGSHRKAGQPRDPKALVANASEIRNARAHNAQVAENLSRLKGVSVRGRQAGKVGAGIALLGVAGALNRNRHEERWD